MEKIEIRIDDKKCEVEEVSELRLIEFRNGFFVDWGSSNLPIENGGGPLSFGNCTFSDSLEDQINREQAEIRMYGLDKKRRSIAG